MGAHCEFQQPVRALLSNVGKEIFGSDHRLEPYYAAAFALYRLEFLFRNQILEPKYKPARYHILLAARLLLDSSKPPAVESNEMRRYSERLLETLWDPRKAEVLFKEAAHLVDETAAGDFHRDRIRTQPFTETLKQKCARAVAGQAQAPISRA